MSIFGGDVQERVSTWQASQHLSGIWLFLQRQLNPGQEHSDSLQIPPGWSCQRRWVKLTGGKSTNILLLKVEQRKKTTGLRVGSLCKFSNLWIFSDVRWLGREELTTSASRFSTSTTEKPPPPPRREEAALPLSYPCLRAPNTGHPLTAVPTPLPPTLELKPLFHAAAASSDRSQGITSPEGKQRLPHPPQARELPGWKRRPRSETIGTRPLLAFRGRPV